MFVVVVWLDLRGLGEALVSVSCYAAALTRCRRRGRVEGGSLGKVVGCRVVSLSRNFVKVDVGERVTSCAWFGRARDQRGISIGRFLFLWVRDFDVSSSEGKVEMMHMTRESLHRGEVYSPVGLFAIHV